MSDEETIFNQWAQYTWNHPEAMMRWLSDQFATLRTCESERDRLKALVEDQAKAIEWAGLWKQKAEKLAKALLKIERGQNKERSTGMDTPPIAVSRDHLRIWAKEALLEFEKGS